MDTPVDPNEFSLDELSARLTELGLTAYVEHTGGGVATIYAGATHDEPGYGRRYAVVAGPGWFDRDTMAVAYASSEEFCFGRDDDGEAMPTYVEPGSTLEQIAQAIAKWARVNA